MKAEENENDSDGDTRVESGGQDVVVLGPPGESISSDEVCRDESNDRPRNEVHG